MYVDKAMVHSWMDKVLFLWGEKTNTPQITFDKTDYIKEIKVLLHLGRCKLDCALVANSLIMNVGMNLLVKFLQG